MWQRVAIGLCETSRQISDRRLLTPVPSAPRPPPLHETDVPSGLWRPEGDRGRSLTHRLCENRFRQERIVAGVDAECRRRDSGKIPTRARPPVVVLRSRESVQGRGGRFVEFGERARAQDRRNVDLPGGLREALGRKSRLGAESPQKRFDIETPDAGLEMPRARREVKRSRESNGRT